MAEYEKDNFKFPDENIVVKGKGEEEDSFAKVAASSLSAI